MAKAKKTKREKNKKLNNTANINAVTLDDIKNANNANNTDNANNAVNSGNINNINNINNMSGVINVIGINPYKIGDIVLATAGRDEDRLFAVVGVLDKEYVFIANGRSRKVDSPKKKKIKHIKLLKEAGGSFAEKVEKSKSGRLTNLILRNVINDYIVQTQTVQTVKTTSEITESIENQDKQQKQDGKE